MRIVTWIARAVVIGLPATACHNRPKDDSPFAINGRPEMAAGVSFPTLSSRTQAPTIKRLYRCKELWAGATECSVETTTGVLVATVNRRGRVVRLKLETNTQMRGPAYYPPTARRTDRVRRDLEDTALLWDLVTPSVDSARGRGALSRHWRDGVSHWSAEMWYQSLYTYLPEHWKSDMARYQDSLAYLPDSVVTTDDLAFDELMRERPPEPPTGPPDDPVERVRFDLTMLASAQSEYFEAHGSYAATSDSLLFAEGDGVQIRIREATTLGWAALGMHRSAPGVVCRVQVGRVALPAMNAGTPPVPAGQIACAEESPGSSSAPR